MWDTSLIVDRLEPPGNPDALRAKEEDRLVLTWEERRWMRGRFTTAKGRKIGIALPTGTVLESGAVLFVGEDWYLRVEAAVEGVLEVIPSSYDEAVKIAFEVGNRHFPLAVQETKILVPDDKVMVRLMERLDVRWERRRTVFNPIATIRNCTNMDRFLSLLQFADGLFPAGAYAHSFGLESCVQAGEVGDEAGVDAFLRAYLEGSAAPTDAVAAVCAHRAALNGTLAPFLALDQTLDAMKAASELREASRQMGRQTLRVATHLGLDPLVAEFSQNVASENTPGHHAVVFGVVGGVSGWGLVETATAYLYSSSCALVGAALRLLPLGQLAGQRILWNTRPLIARLAAEVQDKHEDDMWSFAPALEIASMRHARLEARLFRS